MHRALTRSSRPQGVLVKVTGFGQLLPKTDRRIRAVEWLLSGRADLQNVWAKSAAGDPVLPFKGILGPSNFCMAPWHFELLIFRPTA